MLTVLLIAQIVMAVNVTPANAQTSGAGISETVRCSIESASDEWSKPKPAIVVVRIENVSGRDLKFWAGYTFYLANQSIESKTRGYRIVGDAFRAPAALVNQNGKLALLPNGLEDFKKIDRTHSVSRNEEVNLGRGATIEITVDLSKLRWADRMHSFWPSLNLFKAVQTGKYELTFAIQGDEVKAVSNAVKLNIQGRP